MKFFWFFLAGCLSLAVSLSPAFACGPDFPYSYLHEDPAGGPIAARGFSEQLTALGRHFYPELLTVPRFPAGSKSSAQVDLDDVAAAINRLGPGLAPAVRADILSRYGVFAKACRQGEATASFACPELPAGALQEFVLYQEGVRELNQKDNHSTACPAAWTRLLQLPPGQRRDRTVWVQYMLGNLLAQTNRKPANGEDGLAADSPKMTAEAQAAYAQVRQLVTEGFPDPNGLAAASFRKDYDATKGGDLAVCLRFGLRAWTYYSRFDDKASRRQAEFLVNDLLYLCRRSPVAAVAGDKIAGEVFLAWMVCVNNDKNPKEVLAALAGSDTLLEAENLAFMAYHGGDLECAKLWLEKTSAESFLGIWIRAEIARRAGDRQTAAVHYRHWLALYGKAKTDLKLPTYQEDVPAEGFPSHVYGMLGRIEVDRRDFLEALHCFMGAESWLDAAQVAEGFLQTDELVGYVDALAPQELLPDPAVPDARPLANSLRYLLARRLMREQQYEKALPYMPRQWQPAAKHLGELIRTGENLKLDKEERALAWFNAGPIQRHQGMDLLGTECAPDFAWAGGNYEWPYGPLNDALLSGLIEMHWPPQSPFRFHYRNLAADAMWKAAELSADPELQALAWTLGGSYIANRQPKLANRFFRKLYIQGSGPLAERARRTNWLPIVKTAAIKDFAEGRQDVKSLDEIPEMIGKISNP
jgi:hypothetical protein